MIVMLSFCRSGKYVNYPNDNPDFLCYICCRSGQYEGADMDHIQAAGLPAMNLVGLHHHHHHQFHHHHRHHPSSCNPDCNHPHGHHNVQVDIGRRLLGVGTHYSHYSLYSRYRLAS